MKSQIVTVFATWIICKRFFQPHMPDSHSRTDSRFLFGSQSAPEVFIVIFPYCVLGSSNVFFTVISSDAQFTDQKACTVMLSRKTISLFVCPRTCSVAHNCFVWITDVLLWDQLFRKARLGHPLTETFLRTWISLMLRDKRCRSTGSYNISKQKWFLDSFTKYSTIYFKFTTSALLIPFLYLYLFFFCFNFCSRYAGWKQLAYMIGNAIHQVSFSRLWMALLVRGVTIRTDYLKWEVRSFGLTHKAYPNYSSWDESVRSTSFRSKRQEDQRSWGGVADTEAYTVHTKNISQWQYFVAHCLSSNVGNIFGLHSIWVCFPSTRELVT
jgi:hypothetical protein